MTPLFLSFTFIAIEGFTSMFINSLDEFDYNIRACYQAMLHLRPLHYVMTGQHAYHIVIVVLTPAESLQQDYDAASTHPWTALLRRKISQRSESPLKRLGRMTC
jgi:hypothetical protein